MEKFRSKYRIQCRPSRQDGRMARISWFISGGSICPAVCNTLTWSQVDQICLKQDRQTAVNKNLLPLQAHRRRPRRTLEPCRWKENPDYEHQTWSPALRKRWPLLRGLLHTLSSLELQETRPAHAEVEPLPGDTAQHHNFQGNPGTKEARRRRDTANRTICAAWKIALGTHFTRTVGNRRESVARVAQWLKRWLREQLGFRLSMDSILLLSTGSLTVFPRTVVPPSAHKGEKQAPVWPHVTFYKYDGHRTECLNISPEENHNRTACCSRNLKRTVLTHRVLIYLFFF